MSAVNKFHAKALAIVASVFIGLFPLLSCSVALAASTSSSTGMSASSEAPAAGKVDESKLLEVSGDSAGTVVSFDASLTNAHVLGDLLWAFSNSTLHNSKVDNDLLCAGSNLQVKNSAVAGDMRCVAGGLSAQSLQVDGNVTAAGYDLSFDGDTKATGFYCYAFENIDFEGTADYAFLYGQNVVIDGTIDGDVTVSAQNIEVGPNASISGTLKVHSGQNVEVPETASVGSVDTTQDQPNTIDQVTQLRSMVAPFFQIGGALFTLVSFAIMAAVAVALSKRRLEDANRVVRAKPFVHLGLGVLFVALVPILVALAALLVFTIPLAIALLLLFVLSAVIAIPFAGASLGLLIPGSWGAYQKAIAGTVALSLLCQVPYLNIAVWLCSLAYLLGYLGYALMRGRGKGHQEEHSDAAICSQPE